MQKEPFSFKQWLLVSSIGFLLVGIMIGRVISKVFPS